MYERVTPPTQEEVARRSQAADVTRANEAARRAAAAPGPGPRSRSVWAPRGPPGAADATGAADEPGAYVPTEDTNEIDLSTSRVLRSASLRAASSVQEHAALLGIAPRPDPSRIRALRAAATSPTPAAQHWRPSASQLTHQRVSLRPLLAGLPIAYAPRSPSSSVSPMSEGYL